MRIFRSLLLLVVLVLATNALYIQGQIIYNHHSDGWWKAICEMLEGAWPVTLGSIVVVCIVILWEWRSQKQDDNNKIKRDQKLDEVIKLTDQKLDRIIELLKNDNTKTKPTGKHQRGKK